MRPAPICSAAWLDTFVPALLLTDNQTERAFLERRLAEVSAARTGDGPVS